MAFKPFDFKYQFTFYGQYHTNKINVAIHMLCVPLILWTSMIMISVIPKPAFLPNSTYSIFPPYLSFTWSWVSVLAIPYGSYYFILEPFAALLYMPIFGTMYLSAAPLAATPWGVKMAASLFVLSWIAQLAGHGLAEKRSPAFMDNLLQALVLAPLFVHLEMLFAFGYRPALRKELLNSIGVEVAKYRKEQGEAKRSKNHSD